MLRILIVDDEEVTRAALIGVLADHGMCTICANGDEALKAYQEGLEYGTPFGLVVMDIYMPGMDGIQTLTAIRDVEEERGLALKDRAKVLVLSTTTDPADAMRAYFKAGANCFIPKPVDAEAIREALNTIGIGLGA